MLEVFFSHAQKDHKRADTIRRYLVEHGIPVWFSAHHLEGADSWQDEIGAALERCNWFMILLTPSAVRSMCVQRELRYALMQPRFQQRVIPLLLRDCDYRMLSWVLPTIQMIDFRRDFEEGCHKLLSTWKKRPKNK